MTPEQEDRYCAWMRFSHVPGGKPRIVACESNDNGAMKVYSKEVVAFLIAQARAEERERTAVMLENAMPSEGVIRRTLIDLCAAIRAQGQGQGGGNG